MLVLLLCGYDRRASKLCRLSVENGRRAVSRPSCSSFSASGVERLVVQSSTFVRRMMSSSSSSSPLGVRFISVRSSLCPCVSHSLESPLSRSLTPCVCLLVESLVFFAWSGHRGRCRMSNAFVDKCGLLLLASCELDSVLLR